MKKTLFVCALGAAFAAAGVAHADTVKGTYTFTDNTNSNSLTIGVAPNPGSFTEFGVPTDGNTLTDYFFFGVGANIPGQSNSDQTDQLSVTFDITVPGTGSGSQSGSGTEDQDAHFSIFGTYDTFTSSIHWGAPANITLSDGQSLYIDLGDVSLTPGFLCPVDACAEETATFALTDPPAATPEPGSLALLGTSILGGAGILRRRFRA